MNQKEFKEWLFRIEDHIVIAKEEVHGQTGTEDGHPKSDRYKSLYERLYRCITQADAAIEMIMKEFVFPQRGTQGEQKAQNTKHTTP